MRPVRRLLSAGLLYSLATGASSGGTLVLLLLAARFLEPILDAWGIPHHVVESDGTCHYISEGYQQAQAESRPVAVLMGKEYGA